MRPPGYYRMDFVATQALWHTVYVVYTENLLHMKTCWQSSIIYVYVYFFYMCKVLLPSYYIRICRIYIHFIYTICTHIYVHYIYIYICIYICIIYIYIYIYIMYGILYIIYYILNIYIIYKRVCSYIYCLRSGFLVF